MEMPTLMCKCIYLVLTAVTFISIVKFGGHNGMQHSFSSNLSKGLIDFSKIFNVVIRILDLIIFTSFSPVKFLSKVPPR